MKRSRSNTDKLNQTQRTMIFHSIPVDVKRQIASFLSLNEVISVSSTCKHMRNDLDVAILKDDISHPTIHQNRQWYVMDDNFHPFVMKLTPILFHDRAHTVIFECDWKDQGWGNRKGQLIILPFEAVSNDAVIHSGSSEVLKKAIRSPIAEHHAQNLKLSFIPEPGQNYSIWYRVGGGGGHSLIVQDARIKLAMYGRTEAEIASKIYMEVQPTNRYTLSLVMAVAESLIGTLEREEDPDVTLMSSLTPLMGNVDISDHKLQLQVLLKLKEVIVAYSAALSVHSAGNIA
jgi:hypothetical protein